MKEMNGKYRFVYLDTCGCVMSEQAMKEVPSKTCIKCTKPYEAVNVIVLNPKAEELEAMELALVGKQARIAAEKEKKKKAKANKKELESMNGADSKLFDSTTSSTSKRKLDEATTTDSHKHKKQHTTTTTTTTAANLSSTHSLTAAVAAKVAEQMAVNASRQKSSAIQSLYNNGRVSKENFMNR
jgi:hypothetical protein